jgi:hypothetical protein
MGLGLTGCDLVFVGPGVDKNAYFRTNQKPPII